MTITECPRCGYHLARELRVWCLDVHLAYDAAELDRQEGVSALQAEVRRLEDLIPRLQEEKASLLRRINNAQEKTRRLPFEVLSNIFRFARPPIDFTAHEPINYWIEDPEYPPLTGYFDPAEYFHHTLAAVSHRWRQVALSTPQLWTSISLRVLNTFTEFNTSLLDLYFKNAHNIPISIRLDLSNPALAWTAGSCLKRADFLPRLEPLEEIIFNQNADKIQSLIFIEAPIEWFTRDCGKLSRCTSMTIYWPSSFDSRDFYFDFEDLPCLQHVKLVDNSFQFALPTTVSALQLSDTNPTDSLRPLEELTYLAELEISGIAQGGFPLRLDDNLNSTKLIVLRRLKKLAWNGIRVVQNHDFLRYVRCVNLTTFVWSECGDSHLSTEGERLRLSFFSSLPSTLSSLTLGNVEIDSPGLVDLLCCVPQFAELHFTGSPWEVVVGAVGTIGRRPANRGASSSHSNILPHLYALSVLGTGSKIDAFIFIEMLEALHAAGPRQEQFLLTTNSDVQWRSGALREVRALLSSGMDVKVIYDRGEFTFTVSSD